MPIKTENDIITMIQQDKWMLELLNAAHSLKLPDYWICAGFVRSKIWDVLHGFDERTLIPDIDVIYFDPANIDKKVEKKYEKELKLLLPTIPWSVKNQARMHLVNHIPPYSSTVDAIAKFPETATALGVKLNKGGNVVLTAPHGIEDVVNLVVKPTPFFCETEERLLTYEKRISDKNWRAVWSKVDIINNIKGIP